MEEGKNFSAFLKRDPTKKERVLFTGYRLEVLIPKSYFDLGIASIVGSRLETIGIFKFRIKLKESSKYESFSMRTPSQIIINFDDSIPATVVNGKIMESEKKFDTSKDSDNIEIGTSDSDEKPNVSTIDESDEEVRESYQLFILNTNTAFLESTKIVQSGKNVEKFVRLLYAGKLPSMKYEDVYYYHTKVEAENSVPLGIPASTRAAIIAELCRYSKNKSLPLRIALKSPNVTEKDFGFFPIKSLPDIISTFSGLSFENVNKSLMYGISSTKNGKPEVVTPIEKIVINK